jgi:hypothetical protein
MFIIIFAIWMAIHFEQISTTQWNHKWKLANLIQNIPKLIFRFIRSLLASNHSQYYLILCTLKRNLSTLTTSLPSPSNLHDMKMHINFTFIIIFTTIFQIPKFKTSTFFTIIFIFNFTLKMKFSKNIWGGKNNEKEVMVYQLNNPFYK